MTKTMYITIYLSFLALSYVIIENIPKKEPSLDYARKGLDLIQHTKSINAVKAIKVAIVDTGVDTNHSFLKNNILFADSENDSTGHGTHVAGILKAVNPLVRIYSFDYSKSKYVDSKYYQTNYALKKAIASNPHIISYSGSGKGFNKEEYNLLLQAKNKGILVIVAAGNHGKELTFDKYQCNIYPACYQIDNIIVVGAVDHNYALLYSSNYGKKVDIIAPGYRIKSTLPNNKAGFMSGTSMATPFVTGVASLIMSQNPKMNYLSVKQRIINSSVIKEDLAKHHYSSPTKYKFLNVKRALASEQKKISSL